MEENLTLLEMEDSFIRDLNELGDWFLQYEYLLAISGELPHIPAEERTEDRRVQGCQSGVWLKLSCREGRIRVLADSDPLIIRGLLAIIVFTLDGRAPEEVASYEPRFLTATGLQKQISVDRFNGINSVISTIKDFAAGHLRE
ncbi:MAG: SufE family protein [Oscillospiraceae bacterium]